jgi:hypothetical protein
VVGLVTQVMGMKLLRLETESFSFGLLDECSPYRTNVGNLNVYEVYMPPKEDGGDLGQSKVVIESVVENHSELENRNSEPVELAEELEMLWSYVWTTPLHVKTRGITFELIKPPKGWSTNKEEIRKKRGLPSNTQAEFKYSYHKLFDLANNRMNTRHAVKRNSKEIALHPELEG